MLMSVTLIVPNKMIIVVQGDAQILTVPRKGFIQPAKMRQETQFNDGRQAIARNTGFIRDSL